MIVFFADRKMNILGHATTYLPKGLLITQDLKSEDVDTGVASFECCIPYDKNNRAKVEECTAVGNYLLRSNEGENSFFTILESEDDSRAQEIHIYAEDAGLDLLNEIAGVYEADEAYPIEYYIEKFAYDSGFEIGINEVSNLTRKLSWNGETTVTERLASVATQFDNCEIDFTFDIKNLTVTKKYINIYKERGKDAGVQLRLNKEVDRIVTTKSIANLATALKVTGGIPEDSETPITLHGYEYDDGDIYLEGTYLKSRSAVAIWSRYLAEAGNYTGHICKTFSYDTTSQSELCNRAVSKLKEIQEVEVNYEVDISKLPEDVKIGDRVNIIDDEGGLYLSTRILKLEVSVADKTQKATLGEHLLKTSGISRQIEEMATEFAQYAQSTESALAEAYKAKMAAETAQSTADEAISSAETAQSTADQAIVSADAAQSTATSAQQAADGAQKDVDALTTRVTKAETKITQNSEKIELMATKEDVTETLNGYATKMQMESALTVKADEITASVEKTYATKTEVEGIEIGARNLIRNSANLIDAAYVFTEITEYVKLNTSVIGRAMIAAKPDKLNTPTITLAEVVVSKLDTPVIELIETVAAKLNAPVICMEEG